MKTLLISFMLITSSVYCEVEKLVILGGGPAGLTSAIFAGQSHLKPLVIEGEKSEGQYAAVFRIENFPGFPEGISGQELTDKLVQQAQQFGTRFQSSHALHVDLNTYPFHIILADGNEIESESLIIATGASPKWLGIDSEKPFIGNGISANALLDGPGFANKEVIVVGGGDSAMEQALMLAKDSAKVTMIYKDKALYGSKYLQERVFENPKIAVIFNTIVIEVKDPGLGRITGVVLRDVQSKEEREFFCEGILVANGRKPNTDLFKGQLEMTEAGYIVTQPDTTKTSVAGVFVAGDIAEKAYRKMVTAAASGCMSAIDATRFFSEKKK